MPPWDASIGAMALPTMPQRHPHPAINFKMLIDSPWELSWEQVHSSPPHKHKNTHYQNNPSRVWSTMLSMFYLCLLCHLFNWRFVEFNILGMTVFSNELTAFLDIRSGVWGEQWEPAKLTSVWWAFSSPSSAPHSSFLLVHILGQAAADGTPA